MDASGHPKRTYLYIRQSTLYQVINNTESTARQYDLQGRALRLGWPAERIHVIDIDQGHSGASAADREGFRHLVAEVSLGRAGIVLGLECSRLARDSADWQQLIKICAHNDTLICDEDGLYDPASFNDRLLLGLKGTLAESELHFLRARMQGGLLAKARRGELKLRLPAGLAYDAAGIIMLDPDTEVRGAVQLLLDTFTATGSARAVVAAFNAASLTFPGRHLGGPHAGELYFKPLTHDHVLDVLHNPAYAGAYVYGRSKTSTGMDGHARTRLRPMADWTVFIRDHHPGYLTWSQYERNQAVLSANAASRGEDRAAGPAREGSALLQGVVICGRCGRRMTVGYHTLADRTRVPAYHCQRAGIRNALPACQAITGAGARRRDIRADLRLPHPARSGSRPDRHRRTGRRRPQGRHGPRRPRAAHPERRRHRRAPLPGRRPRQPAGGRQPGSRLERPATRTRRRPRRLRPGPRHRRRAR